MWLICGSDTPEASEQSCQNSHLNMRLISTVYRTHLYPSEWHHGWWFWYCVDFSPQERNVKCIEGIKACVVNGSCHYSVANWMHRLHLQTCKLQVQTASKPSWHLAYLFVLFLSLRLWKTVRVDAGFVFTWQETGLLSVWTSQPASHSRFQLLLKSRRGANGFKPCSNFVSKDLSREG